MLVDTPETWVHMRRSILTEPGDKIYFDTETTGFDPHTEKLVMIQLKQAQGEPFVIDCRQGFDSWQRHFMKTLFTNCYIVGHNLKFDLAWVFKTFGVWPMYGVWDTMLVQQVIVGKGLSSARAEGISFGLKQLALDYAHINLDKDTREYFIGLDKRTEEVETEEAIEEWSSWHRPFPDKAVTYAALDVEVLDEIYWGQMERYESNKTCGFHNLGQPELRSPGLSDCIDLENRTVLAMAHVELSGVPLDVGDWTDIIDEKREEAKRLENDALALILPVVLDARSVEFDALNTQYMEWERAREGFITKAKQEHNVDIEPWGEGKKRYLKLWTTQNPKPVKPKLNTEFNLGSSAQLMEVFSLMGVPCKSTSVTVLEPLEDKYPVVKAVLDWRKANKFVDSFGESVTSKVNPRTHRLHCDYIQIGADSNRSSCTKPNWQQVPARSETGKRLRACVRSDAGWKMLDADFSSQELCILAELSGDENMLAAFENGIDLHVHTARLMFRLDESVDTRKHMVHGLSVRDIAKTINYGIAYGMTRYRLSRIMHSSTDESQEMIDLWYSAYPGCMKWLEARKDQVNRGQWYSTTLHGWTRRYKPLGPEPIKPTYSSIPTLYKAWKEHHREWEMERGGLQNQMMNTPIQGTGAGMTKLALTLFFERAILKPDSEYAIRSTNPRIIAVVHDEIVVEALSGTEQHYAKLLAECMNEAESTFLKRVKFPKAEVHIGESWEH